MSHKNGSVPHANGHINGQSNGHTKSNGHVGPVSNGHVAGTTMLPESDTGDEVPNNTDSGANVQPPVRLQENLGLVYAIAVIISLVVGTGIYLTPQGVIRYAGSVHLSLIVWILSGVLSFLGALCFAELGTTFPGSGAHYVYLEKMYGPCMAFLYLWTMVFLVRPGLNALKALVFAKYLLQPFFTGCDVPEAGVPLIAVCLVCEYTF